jgi:hypothetical protein
VVGVDAAAHELADAAEAPSERDARVRSVDRELGDDAGAEAHRAAAHVEDRVVGEQRAGHADGRAVPELEVPTDVHRDRALDDDHRVATGLQAAQLVRAGGQMQALARLDDDVSVRPRRQRHVAPDDEGAGTRREHGQRRHRIDERQRTRRLRAGAVHRDARRRGQQTIRIEIVERDAVAPHPVADDGRAVREDVAGAEDQREPHRIVHADVTRRDRREILEMDAIRREEDVVVQVPRWACRIRRARERDRRNEPEQHREYPPHLDLHQRRLAAPRRHRVPTIVSHAAAN